MLKPTTMAAIVSAAIVSVPAIASACSNDQTSGPCRCGETLAQHVLHTQPGFSAESTAALRARPPAAEALVIVHVFNTDFSINPSSGPIVDPIIDIGDTIRWDWDDGPHSVTSASGSDEDFDSGIQFSGDDFEWTFPAPGVFTYYCTQHGIDFGGGQVFGMSGTVTVVAPPASTWKNDAGGNWEDAGSWDGVVPNSNTAHAVLGSIITAPRTVTLSSAQTLATLTLNNTNAYTIAGTGQLVIDGGKKFGLVEVLDGGHEISSAVRMVKNTIFFVDQGSALAVNGALTADAGVKLIKSGEGVLQVPHVRADELELQAGLLVMLGNGGASGTSRVKSMSLPPTAPLGKLDLFDNDLIVDYDGGSPLSSIQNSIAVGVITASAATEATRLGYGEASTLGVSTFSGQTVDATSVLVKFTYVGDANLDGQVDITDLGKLATAWQTNEIWTGGDFDYSGFIDITDLGMLATNWQAGVGSPLGPGIDAALRSFGLPSVSVPEPAGVTLLGAMSFWLRRRQR